MEKTWYADLDQDGLGNPDSTITACTQPVGFVGNALDKDQDCLNPPIWYRDMDGDTLGDPAVFMIACNQPEGYVTNADDSDNSAGPPSTRLTIRPAGDDNGSPVFHYGEYLPAGYDGDKHQVFGLIINWHGIGENGESNGLEQAVTENGPLRYVSNDTWANPDFLNVQDSFLILAPRFHGVGSACATPDFVKEFIDFAMERYDIDPNRVYLTGLSCGAIAIDGYTAVYYENSPVAASILISGRFTASWAVHGCSLNERAFWEFHGLKDKSPTDETGTIIPFTYLLTCADTDTSKIKLTTYEGVAHRAWERTFDLTGGAGNIYEWLWRNPPEE